MAGLPLALGILIYLVIIVVLTVWLRKYHFTKRRFFNDKSNHPVDFPGTISKSGSQSSSKLEKRGDTED